MGKAEEYERNFWSLSYKSSCFRERGWNSHAIGLRMKTEDIIMGCSNLNLGVFFWGGESNLKHIIKKGMGLWKN